MTMWTRDNEFLRKEIFNVHQGIMLKARDDNERELDNIEPWMSSDIVLIDIILRTVANPSEELPVFSDQYFRRIESE